MRVEALVAAILVAASVPAAAADLGTLITTPQERERLDRLRRGEPEAAAGGAAARGEITGFVKRSDGHGTLWIDGVPLAVEDRRAARLMEPDALRASDVPRERLRIEHRPRR